VLMRGLKSRDSRMLLSNRPPEGRDLSRWSPAPAL
jgi:hypothetical protein